MDARAHPMILVRFDRAPDDRRRQTLRTHGRASPRGAAPGRLHGNV